MGSNCCKCGNDKKNKQLASSSSDSSGPWTRGDDPLTGERFSSSTQRGAVTLSVRNASVEDSGRYSLSASNDGGSAQTDLLLEVRTRPGDVPVFLRRLNDLAVKVGTRTRFLVEVRSSTQVKVSWEQEGRPVVDGERFHLLHEGSFFCVDVAPVTLDDAGLWICRSHNANGTATCFCHLNVLVPKAYKAPHFLEELMALLTQQGTVSLECKVVGVPTPTLRWFKDSKEIKAGDVFALTANPQDATSLGTYTCEATNCMGKAYSTSKVHVLGTDKKPIESLIPRGPAPVFAKELRNEKVKIGGKLTLECKVTVPPWPSSISWYNKEGQVVTGGRYRVTEDGLGAYGVEVDPVQAVDEGQWKCVATSDCGAKGYSTGHVTVSYPKNYKKPRFLESLKAILTEEGLVSFECKVVGYPTPQLQWFKDGQELRPGDVYQLTGTNSLGSYCCIARNCMGETSSTAELTVEDIQSQLNEEERMQLLSTNQPPRFMQGLKSMESKITEHLRLTVQVSVSPQPAVAWYRDDEEVQDSEKYKKEQETKGFCHLTIKKLELVDQAEWKCVATNDYGQSVTSCFLKLNIPRHFKKPRFLENLRAVLSEEGAVNLECKVIGVPQPTLKWYKDGRELKPGDIHRIISGQDGTCCLGTYTCEATNCMGTVASSASLLGFEDRAQVKTPEPLRPVPPPAAHLVRQPSLSTIQEERTSQMHDVTATLDDRNEVSFSFDGKEVSVSLYETPDLTEEEALQVVEMYAEELSEHISEHNVVELPPMRFVKETSTSGHLLMEAVVIDVSPEYYASAEDRTEADLDEFSITEDNGLLSPAVLAAEEMPFDTFTSDFLERSLQPMSLPLKQPVPLKPPRKRSAERSESEYHSLKEAKVSPEEENSEPFVDALSSPKDRSTREAFASATSGSEEKKGAVTNVERSDKKEGAIVEVEIDVSLKESDGKIKEAKTLRKKSRSRSHSTESRLADKVDGTDPEKKCVKKLKKRKSSDSEKEDDSLREFEKRKSLKSENDKGDVTKRSTKSGALKKHRSSESEKEDDSLQEFESRKSLQKSEQDIAGKFTKTKKSASDSSGREDDSLIEYEKRKRDVSEKPKLERQKITISKSISTDSSEKDEAFAIKSESSEARKKKKKSVKRSSSTENKDQTSETGVEIPPSSEAESYGRESYKGKKGVSTSDLDRMRSTSDLESIGDKSRGHEEDEHSADFDTAEDSAYDKSEMSVLESLTHSVNEIRKGLAAVGEKVVSESSEEPQSAVSSLSVIESLAQPISEIQRGLARVEKIAEQCEAGQYSPSSILETLKEPIKELQRNLAVIEEAQVVESDKESLLKRTSQTVLETVCQPLQELQKEIAFIQQQAVIETGEDTYSEMLKSFKPSLLVVQGGVEQSEREPSSKLDDLTDATVIPQATYAQSVQELQRGLAEIRDQQVLQGDQSESCVPLTVQDIEDSFAETATSVTTIGGLDLSSELMTYGIKLQSCMKSLKDKAQTAGNEEIRDILLSTSDLIPPLEQFKTVVEKCLKYVAQNEQSTDPQIRSVNVVLKASLEGPVHALDKSLHLLESIANSKSDKEIRGLGIKVLYKLSFPLEELKTTMKLVENLSEQTSIELMTTPVETLLTSAEVINLEDSKVGFVEDIPSEGVKLLKELDGSSNALSSALQFVTKSLSVHSPLSTLKSLSKPLADLQKNLRKIDKKINTQDKCDQLSCSEVHSLAQDLCKPLQAIRTELSIAQHEIELDQYSQITIAADPVSGAKVESAACVVHESLEQTLKSVLTCTEFILSKTPNERSHVRYLLYALNELIFPLNQLTSSITKAGDLVRKEAPTLAEPEVGIQVVTTSTNGLLDALSALQHQSVTSLPPPESAVIQEVCTMADPLAQVENGLHRIIKHVHEEDKQVLNINMLKTLAEPFKYLQKSLLNISEKLDSELVSQEIFLDLRQPIQELQRSILIIQDQVSFEYGDEPATIESNIITLQSLVQPMNALRKQFMEIDGMMLEESQSTAYDQENKHLHSIINANHEVQLKLSSIMIEENYLTKHSLDSLDMFPIFQNLSGVLRDFENALNRVALVCQNQTKPDVLSHNKMCETVNSFKGELVELQNRIVLVSNKAIKDVKHPVHSLKKETEKLLDVIVASSDVITKCALDDSSIMSANTTFSKNMCKAFSEFLNYLVQLENVSDYSPNEDASKLSANVSLISSSDTIKDVTTIVEEITRSRVSLESDVPSKHTSLLKTCSELQSFCDSLKTAESSILKNTLVKANSLNVDKDEERRALRNAFNNMKDQLEKIENHVTNNQEALESINHLKYTIEVIQEHLTYGEEISEVYILQNLSGPLRTFKDSITKDTCVTSTEPIDTASISTYLDKFEKSASDLELGLMKLEHALLNTTGDYSNLKNIDIGVLAHPIEELVHFINIIEEQEKAVDQSETLAEQSSFSMLKTLATPIREIQQGVVEIQEQIALESITKSSRSCAGILYDIAKPIRELRSGVALIQEQIVILEGDVEPFSDDTRVSSLKTLAAPVQELKRVLTSIIQQQTLMLEPDVQSMSENLSILKTIAQPINELQNKLAAIEMNQIMEGNVDSMSFKETLLTLAQPILVLQEGIAKVENQLVLEHIGEDISVQTNISLLKMVAKPLLEVAKGIALVTEEQLGEKGLVEDVSVMSDLSTFANLTDVSMATDILRIDEPVVLEHDESFSDNLPSVQVARLNTEKALEVGICQQQQSLIGEDIQSLQESAMVRKPEHLQVSTEVVQEVCSPIVALQQTLSQADTLTLTEEKTLQAANIKDSSMKEAIQGHIQEALLPVEILSTNEESLKVAQIQEGDSIQTQKQVKVEAVSVQEDVLHAEELQQSLADVDSFKTEEDTLKSIRGDKLQSLSDIESFKSAENEFQASEPKDGSKVALQKETELILSHAAVQAEIQEFISVAEGIQSLKEELQGKIASNPSLNQAVKQDIQKVIDFAEEINLIKEDLTAKSIEELSLQQGAQVEMQLVLNACEQFQQVKKEFEVKPVKELSLESSVQMEVQQIISTVDDLNIIQQTIKARISAVSSANVDRSEVNEKPIVLTAPIQSDIGNFISVAEEIISMKDNVEAKLTTEPQIKKAAKQEIQLLLACAEEIQSVKTSLQAKLSSEPLNQQATQIEIKQVLHACDSLQNAKEALSAKSGEQKLQSAVQAELQQILSSADTLQTIKQSITAKVAEVESLNSTAQIEKVEIKTSVEHPDKLDKAPSTKADKVVEKSEVQPQLTTTQSKPQQEVPTAEGSVKTPIQTDIQEFISVAEDFKDVKESLQAKIASEPQLKKAAQQEIQQLLSCVDEIQAVKESLQAKTASEPSFHQATEIEIQQVLHACESLQNAKEALEAKSGKLKLHSAVQAELQQILSSSDTLQTIKQSITAKVAEVESLTDTVHVEKMEVKTSVDLSDKLEKVPTKPEEEVEVIQKPEVKEILSTEKAITAQDKLENQNKVEIQRKEDKVELIKKKEIKQVSKQKEDEVGEQLHSQTVTIPDETSGQIKIEQTEIQAGTEQTALNLQQETNVKSAITDEKVVISKPPEETSKLQMKKETITTQQTSAQQGSEEKDVTITKTSASETITGKTDDIKEIAIVKKTTEKDVVDSGVESKMIKGKEKEIMLKDKPEPKSGKISKEDSEEQSTPGSKEGGIKVFIDSDINKCQDDSSKLKISKEIVNDTQKQLAKEDDASLSKTDSKEKEIIVTKDEIVPLAEAKEPLKSKPQEDKSETGASASKSSLKEEFIVKEQELTNKDEEPSKTEIMSKKEKIKPQENKSSTEEKEKTKTDIVTKESEEKLLESQQKITKEGKTSLVEKNKTEIEDDQKEAQKSLNKDEKAALKEKPVSKTKELPEKKINDPLEEQEIKPKDDHTSHKQEDNKPKKETNKDGKNEEGEINSKKSSLKENQSLQVELESDKHKTIEKKVPSEVVSKESEIKSDVQPSQTEEDKSKKEPSTTKVSKEKKDKLTEAKKSQESSVKTEVTPTEKLNTSDVKPKLPEESKVNIEDKQINKGGKIADKSEVKTDENIKKDELPSKTAEDTKRSKDLKRKSESRKNSDGTVKASSKNSSESVGKPIEQSITYVSEVTTSQTETTPGDQEKETGKGEIVPSKPEDSVKKPSVKKGKDARKKSISPKKTTGPLPTNKLIEDKTAKDDTNKEDVSTKEVDIASVKRDNTDMDTKKVVEVSEIKSTEPKKESSELKTRIRKPVSPDLEKETIVSPTRKRGDIRDTYKSSNTQETNEDKGAGLRKGYETPREEHNIENKLYIDESSTSDYSSQSQSESYNLKKSQSYESRQWIYDSKPEVKRDETLSTYTPKPVSERKRYESPTSASILEGTTYQRRETAAKPLFCGRLVDRTAAQGSRLRVTCSLIGSPEPNVQWFKDGQPLTTADPRLQTRLSNGLASLEINAATLGDSGKYTCIARNQNGEATTTSRVKIFSYLESAPEAPVFTQQVKGEYKFSADELVIQCRVKGYPLPTVSWFKDGLPLHASSRYQQTVARDGTCRLVVHGPEPSDSGLYKCVAENAVWSEHTSGCVMFEGREKYLVESRSLETRLPRFTNILSEHVVREGGTVALQVAIKGSPRADVTWYRGSEPLPKKSSRFRYLEDAGVYSLVMSDASTAEAGTYTCRAANAHGYRDTALFLQVVGGASRGKPAMFVSRPDTTHNIAMGEDINFAFRVSGDPKPKVTWMKGMKDITNNIRTMKETVNDYVRLTLNHATAVDSGTYFIMAKNCHGADHAFVTVRVRQRARSLTPTRSASLWSAPDTSTILRDIHESTRALVNDVPGPVSGEATVTDRGKNWVSLSWGKPEHRGAAPVLAYRVESWMLGSEGGAQWTELGVTPINSFDVFFLKPGGEYKFRITARNRYGWGESVTSTEPVVISSGSDTPPDIVRDLEGPLKALLGDSLTLECEITGDPAPSIQWLRDGQDVGTVASLKGRVFVSDSQTTHRLTVQQLSEDDSGRYVCEAVNPQGRASTYARLLVVSDPRLLEADRKLKEDLAANKEFAPQLTMRLRDRRVQQSYPVRLTCQVAANPAPTITWAHDGQPITDDGGRYTQRVEADHFYTLELPRTLLEDGGQYSVTAQNCLGAVSCSCQLVVDKGIRAYVAPDFIAPLDLAASVAEGAELRIFAQVEAYPSVGIAWQRDGVRLRPSRRLVMTVDPEGRVELALAHITSRDAGLYCCTATNAVGRAETTCHVSVTAGGLKNASLPSHPSIVPPGVPYSKEPRFVTKPRCSEAVEGDTVVITCEVVGDPQPEVMWLRDWLKPGYYRDAPQFRQVAGGSGIQYSLEIPQVKLDFTGTYCVIATNPHGEAKAIISLQIYAKGQGKESSMVSGQVKHGKVETLPEIKRELKDLRCCDGDSATLECLVTATPLPAVRWEKDGKILPLGEDIEAEVQGEVARLTIRKVYPEDEGQYSCVAYNDLGRAVTSACLVVDVPEEKDTLLSQQLTRPPGLLSARSTPRSTPRHTPSPSRSISPGPSKYREFSSPSFSRPKRIKMSSPKFYTVPHNRIAEEGETIRFQCAVAGHPTPWASWDKDGHIVTPSARLSVTERDDLRTLELREVTVDDAGLYRVTLENEMGSVEATARLDVIGRQGSRTRSVRAWSAHRASPTFGRRLVGSAARVGGTFTLSCDVHASPSPATSWYRNGELLVLSDRVLPSWDGRRAQLELRGLQPEDGGVYTCVAENSAGTTQCAAELRVLQTTERGDTQLQPPVFLQGLSAETTAAEGVPLELQVRLQGSGPLEVVWVKDGLEVPDCEDFRHVDYGDGRYGLRIADVFPADAGTYNCEAFNDHGDAITSGHLIVSEPEGEPRKQEEPEICFTKTPGPVVGRLRGQASFCARLRLPDTRLSHTVYSWTVGGRNVSSSDDRFTVTTEDDCSILQIRDIRSTDAGPVTCTARVCSPGEPPTTVTCGTHLSLDCAPGSPATLLRGPCDTTAMRGDRVLLKATYRGSPEPTVRWLRAGRELRTEGRLQIISQEGVSCLTISAITADDSGKYVVSVENIHGADCHYASVAVEGPPEPPAARPSVSAATGEGGAVVAWSSPPYDGGCVLTGYRLEMRPADSADWSVVADRCHSLSHVVCGLEAGCSYVFRVRAENIHGASESSAESFPFTFHPPVTESQEDDEEEPNEENESRLVSLEPGEEFTQRYSVHEELGKGRYGVVHKVTDLRSGQTMAAKFVRCIKQQDREKVQEEIDIMNCLRHPKLLQLTAAFSNPRDVVMVTEYISGGELFERVVADDFTLTERDCILFLRQICEGVSYMHKNNVVHLDLKPENIMCQTRTSHRIKIIDFGLAQKLASNTPVRVLFGTPEFIPPEIINYEPIGVETDMWSVGVITYVLLSGLSPFMGDNDAETFANITRADYDFDDEAFDAISQDAKDFIGSLLVKRKEERPTADECLRHDWLTQCDLTMSCVKLSTDKLKKFIIRRKWQPRQIRRQIA